MIPQSTIDRIVDAANIVDVVSDYVTLRRAGASYKGLCPFHDDKTPSFSVSPARGVCKCFSCGKGGNSVHFIMEMEQMSYVEALKHLAKKYGIPVEEEEMTDEQRQKMNERESMFAVNEWAAKYFSQTMQNNQDGRAVGLAYFRSRGFRDDIIAKFRLGFCLDSPNAMSDEAKAKGYKEKYLIDTGLCVKRDNGTIYDRFRGRAMFPWIAVNGKVVAFGGRVLDARTKGVSQKYVNSPDSLIYHKANELYGIFQAKKQIAKEDMVYMVEGYTDVLAMHQCGIENVVANSGTALNEAQIHLLHRFTNNITLLYDGDEAGIHAATRSTDMLLAEGMNVKILLLPDGDDPDSFSRKHNAQEFKEYVAAHQTDFILFKSNLLLKDAQRDPIKRAKLTEEIVRSIAVIPDEIIRSTYVHECAEILNMDEAVLMRSANKNRAAIIENMKKEAQRERERQERLLNNAPSSATPSPNSTQTQNIPTGISTSPTDIPDDIPPFDAFPPEDFLPDFPTEDGSPVSTSSPILTKQHQSEQRLIGIERMIMALVTRYGEQLIDGEDANGENIQTPLAEYVQGDLAYDNIAFRSSLYAKMLQLTCAHIHDSGFIASKFLLNNQEEDISREAADLISERYQLSKGNQMEQSEEELKSTYVSRLLLDYKNAIIEEELKQCNADLTRPEVKDDINKTLETMRRIKELSEIQRQLAKLLGDRVVVK
ncbi:MAG: DNA primase [Bacteroidaceae bacterium]|nr:DNA primase [Bacteroidaceae bacterium]